MNVSTQSSSTTELPHHQEYDVPDSTLMYGHELIEDLTPLLEQGRLRVTLNGVNHHPPVIKLHERTSKTVVDEDSAIDGPTNMNPLRDDTQLFRRRSCGFSVHLQFEDCPQTAGYWTGHPQTILTIHGVHNNWVSQNCGISDYHTGRNDDGYYEMSLEIDRFEKGGGRR